MAKRKTKKPKLIPAVAYCRKSTNEERAEKSIKDQKKRIKDLTPQEPDARYEIIRWYTLDKGVPGWKRGAERPDYFLLVNELAKTKAEALLVDELAKTKAEALLVDDMDRFSRADEMETVADVQKLREKGVDIIHAVNQGSRNLHEPGAVHIIAAQANASHEHCTRGSRRIVNARLDAALGGKRGGGRAPYGMKLDGKGGLLHGDKAEVKQVRWMFREFAENLQSLNSIANESNKKGVPSPRGGKWYTVTVRGVLTNEAYRGDFVFNREPQGQFHRISDDRKVEKIQRYGRQEAPKKNNGKAVIRRKGVYTPVVDPKLFDKAQKRLSIISGDRSRRKRQGYALTGVLVCDKCGGKMVGHAPKGLRKYRCNSASKNGKDACRSYTIREDRILPFVLKLLHEEITDLKKMQREPPDELEHPAAERTERRERLEQERDELAKRIDVGLDAVFETPDKRNRQALDKKIVAMQNHLDKLEAELEDDSPAIGMNDEEYDALEQWYVDFYKKAVKVPLGDDPTVDLDDMLDETGDVLVDGRYELADPALVNDTLLGLGAEVRLRWETVEGTSRRGKPKNSHTLKAGRFRLGQRSGKLPAYLLEGSLG